MRDYKREYARYQGKPEQIRNRAQRNAARREAEKAGMVRKGDGRDVDHRTPISKGGGNARENLRVTSKHANRSFSRTPSGRMR